MNEEIRQALANARANLANSLVLCDQASADFEAAKARLDSAITKRSDAVRALESAALSFGKAIDK